VRYASACGALAVTRAGAQPSLPHAPAVEALLEKQTNCQDAQSLNRQDAKSAEEP
jgi:hypothetical protein